MRRARRCGILVCTLDLQVGFNDCDAQEQSYGFGCGMLRGLEDVECLVCTLNVQLKALVFKRTISRLASGETNRESLSIY